MWTRLLFVLLLILAPVASDKELDAALETNTSGIRYEWRYPLDPDDPDSAVAYWREDLALNFFHWRWHSVYPAYFATKKGDYRDRMGEMFSFIHAQILARYDAERLSAGIPRVLGLHEFADSAVIPGYDSSHLNSSLSGRVYPPRPRNLTLSDMNPENFDHMNLCYHRIVKDIAKGRLKMKNGTELELVGRELELLGGLILGANVRKQFPRYCEFHGEGHFAFSHMHDIWDDEDSHAELIALPRGAMRDPLFYSWHKLIDNIFAEYRKLIPPYTRQQLEWPGVRVQSVGVQGSTSVAPNKLTTFWQGRNVTLNRGVDFALRHPVKVHARHIQHEPFEFVLRAKNEGDERKEGLVRIFLAPAQDESGADFNVTELTKVFIEMDSFVATLSPGENTIRRKSSQSSFTNDNFRRMTELGLYKGKDASTEDDDDVCYCSCGYPDNLFIPRGKPQGMEFILFAIVTDAVQDMANTTYPARCSRVSPGYCGAINSFYPDKRPLGFPFDRFPSEVSLRDFLVPNSAFAKIKIFFLDHVLSEVESNPEKN